MADLSEPIRDPKGQRAAGASEHPLEESGTDSLDGSELQPESAAGESVYDVE